MSKPTAKSRAAKKDQRKRKAKQKSKSETKAQTQAQEDVEDKIGFPVKEEKLLRVGASRSKAAAGNVKEDDESEVSKESEEFKEEQQGPVFHHEDDEGTASIWSLQAIMDLYHGTKFEIPILDTDPDANLQLLKDILQDKGGKLYRFEIVRDSIEDEEGNVIGCCVKLEYLDHETAERAFDYTSQKYDWSQGPLCFPLPEDRFTNRHFQLHLPRTILETKTIPKSFDWRCPPNMVDPDAWIKVELTVTPAALELVGGELEEENCRNVLASTERIFDVISILYLYNHHGSAANRAESPFGRQ